jgi:peptide/nickel transport system substrate-binding protein
MSGEGGFWNASRWARLSRRRLLATTFGTGIAVVACAKTPGRGANQATPGAAETPQTGGVLTVSLRTSATTLDTHRTTSGVTKTPVGAVMSRLLRYKTSTDPKIAQNHEVEADLALSAESPDAITWTLKLRPDARFHNVPPVNGHAVEAEDIKASFTRALAPENPGRVGLDMIDASQIQTPDKATIVFKLKYPYAPFKSTLASPTYAWIFPREALAGSYDPGKQVIGSGPFLFESFTPDVAFKVKRNPDWFEKGRPYVDGIQWSIIPEAAQEQAQFTGGHLDIAGSLDSVTVPVNDVETLKRSVPKAQVVRVDPGTPEQELYFQLADPGSAFVDVRARRAISMAIDRDALAKAIYSNDSDLVFYVPLWMGKWAMRKSDLPVETAQYYKYDPAAAKKLLSEAGAADRQFRLVYALSFIGPLYEQVSQAIANMLAGIGIKVTPVSVDYQKDYIGGGKGIRYGNYDKDWIISAGPSGFDETDEYLFNYYDSQATGALSHVRDSALDAMIDKARATVNEDDRVKAYFEAQRYVADRVYTVAGLPQPYIYTMAGPRVRNYQHSLSYAVATETYSKVWLNS